MGNRLYEFLTYIPRLLKHKANSQPYYRDKNIRNSLYRQGEQIKVLSEAEKKNRADLEAMILSMGEKIDGGISLTRAQEIYTSLVKASEENPLIRNHIISAEVSHSLDKMTIYLLSHPEFRDRLTDLYNAQQKHIEAQTKLEERRQKQMRRTVRVVGTTIVATTLAIGATYVGKGYYDRKYVGETLDSMNGKIVKVSEQLQSDKEAKMITDGQTSLKINSLETLIGTKASTLSEDISTIIAKTGNYEIETEKSFKKIQEDSARLEQEKTEAFKNLTETLKTQTEKITEQDKKIKTYESKLEEQEKIDTALIERLNKLEKLAATNSPVLN